MGIIAAAGMQYENAIKKLFPQGDYWDEQFADPESDASLFVRAKADELIRFRGRMRDLYYESRTETSEELIEDWERVLLNELNVGKTLTERQELLLSKENDSLNRAVLQKIAGTYGFNIVDISFCRPAFFGFSCFGIDRIAGPAFWQVIIIFVDTCGSSGQIEQFEASLQAKLLANYRPQFFYDGGKS